MQTSVYNVEEKFQNRYEKKTMFNFEPKIMREISVAEVFHCNLIFASKSSSTIYKIASNILLITIMYRIQLLTLLPPCF